MNVHLTSEPPAALAANASFSNAPRVARRLGELTALHLALLLSTFLPALLASPLLAHWHVRSAPPLELLPAMLRLARGALLVSLSGLLAVCLVVSARARRLHDPASTLLMRVAGPPQALLLCAGAGLALLALGRFWIATIAPDAFPGPAGAIVLLSAGFLFAGFLLLVSERAACLIDPASLPEAHALAAMMRLPVIVLPALALLCALEARLPLAVAIGERLLAVLVAAGAVEMAIRTLVVWYAPPPTLGARGAVGCLVVTLLDPRRLSPSALGVALNRNFGIDFARSWALAFARRAAPPVLAMLLCLCWILSGVSRVGLNQRAVYERFGAPEAVLDPGLHLLLPWPLGRTRLVEYGTVHSILLIDGAPIQAGAAVADRSTAEGFAPASANRLWDQSGTETPYLVARVDEGQQSFEAVSVDLRVLYRVGLSPQAARDALYVTADPQLLIRVLARRLLSRLLAVQTLSDVMVERHDQLAGSLRRVLQLQLDQARSGIEIVGLVVDALHPPAGAASAYRAVQAAEIAARMAITQERGRARSTASLALRDARETLDAAQGQAAETVQLARAEQTRMLADDRAWHAGGEAFLMERRLADLRIGLGHAPLEIIDEKLPARLLDLRPGSPSPPSFDPDQGGRAP